MELLKDVRHGIRGLLKSPGFTAVALITLALGIGANTAIFSLVNAVLLRPLPYDQPGQLIEIVERDQKGHGLPVDYLDFVDWRRQSDVFESMSCSATFSQTLRSTGPAERIAVTFASADFFRTLKVQPLTGRDFLPEDDARNAAPVAVLTHAFWQSRFGGDAGLVGKTVTLDQTNYTIVGILPPTFRFHRGGDVYVAFGPHLSRWGMDKRGNHNNAFVTARLKPGVTLERARMQMDAIARRMESLVPGITTGIGVTLTPLRDLLSGGSRERMLVLLGAVGFVLLIACVNVASLMLARAAARRKEIAIRAALGAGRLQIVRHLLVESLLLATAAGALGLVIAKAAFGALVALLPSGFEAGDVSLDGRVLAFTLALACLTGVLFGLVPALQASRVSLVDAMKEGGKTSGAGEARTRVRSALVIVQVGIAVVLLTGASLLAQSFYRLMQVNPGYRAEHVLTIQIGWPDADSAGIFRMINFYDHLLERAATLPGVRAAGAVWPMPLGGGASIPFYRSDKPLPERGRFPEAGYHSAMPGYFRAMGIPLLKGRVFTKTDGVLPPAKTPEQFEAAWRGATFAVVISESMARRHWPGEDPIGKRFRFGPPEFNGPWAQVYGVVGDVRHFSLDRPAEPEFYISAYQNPNDLTLVIRTDRDPAAIAPAVRNAAMELERGAPLSNIRTMEQMVAGSVAPQRTNMLLIGAFAMLALLLAAVGIYGVVAYSVNRRTHEIGIRMALGAAQADVLGMVIRQAGRLAASGIAIGICCALALTRLLKSMLFGIKSSDPATFAAVAIALIAIALLASYVPARRATRVNPIAALRSE